MRRIVLPRIVPLTRWSQIENFAVTALGAGESRRKSWLTAVTLRRAIAFDEVETILRSLSVGVTLSSYG